MRVYTSRSLALAGAGGLAFVLTVAVAGCGAAAETAPAWDHRHHAQSASELVAEHGIGCGALDWYETPLPQGGDVSPRPIFMAARTDEGEVLVAHINVDARQPVYYTDGSGRVRSVYVKVSTGVAHLPGAPEDELPAVWQAPARQA
jgi:hypothetical protein